MPKRGTDAPWTIIRRIYFAIRVHDVVYGYKARPFGRVPRLSWACLLAHYTGSRSLEYDEVLRVAEDFARDLRVGSVLVPDPATDRALREELSRRLVAAARAKAAWFPAKRATRAELREAWIRALAAS